MSSKTLVAGFIMLTVLTIGGVSVMGIMQSTERVGASGIIIRPAPTVPDPIITPSQAPNPPPPEPTVEIDVYSDIGCTKVITNVAWGEIEAGSSSNKNIYIKNNGDTNVVLMLSSDNWSPSGAATYMTLSWNYDGSTLSPSEVKQVKLTLSVNSACPELSNFGFDIVIIGS